MMRALTSDPAITIRHEALAASLDTYSRGSTRDLPAQEECFPLKADQRSDKDQRRMQQDSLYRLFNSSLEARHGQTEHPPAGLQELAIVAAGRRHVGRDQPCEQLRLQTGR
jgi:hypothetical protein